MIDPGTALIASSIIGGGMSFFGQSSANAANMAMSREMMDFQERMSSTAHQREVADLRAAGLNPILSATKGGGASTPAGSMPRIENALAGASDKLSSGISSALAAQKINLEMDNLKEQNELLRAQTKATEAGAYKTNVEGNALFQTLPNVLPRSNAELEKLRQELPNLQQTGANLSTTGAILHEELGSAKMQNVRDKQIEEFLKENPRFREFQMWLELLGLGGRAGSSARSAIGGR